MSKVGISTCPVRSVIPPPVPPRPNKAIVAEALAKAMQDNRVSNPRPIPSKKPNVILEYKSSRINRSAFKDEIKMPSGSANSVPDAKYLVTPSPPDNSYKNVVYSGAEEKSSFEKSEKCNTRVQFSEEHIYEDLMDVNGKNSPTHHHHPDLIPFSVSPDNLIKVTNAVNKDLQPLGKLGNRFVLTNQNRDDKQKFNRAVPLVLPTGQHMHSDVLYPSQQNSIDNALENLAGINSLKTSSKENYSTPKKETFPLVENLIVELKESSQKRSQREQNTNYPVDHVFNGNIANINISKENIPSPVEQEMSDFQPNIRHSDWFEVEVDGNGNGSAKAVRYSTCQITVEDLPVSSNSNCNSFDSRASRHRKKPRVAHMSSLQGLPPLPKSLSGFNLFESGSNIYVNSSDQQQQHAPPLPPPSSVHRAGISRSRVHPNTTPPPPPPHHLRHQQNGIPRDPKSPVVDSRKPTFLDAQLALLRKEMCGLRQLDMSLLSQLWSLNESIQEFRQLLQEQEEGSHLSPPSPSSAEEGEEFYSPMRYHHPPPPVPEKCRLSSSSSQSSVEYGDV